MSIFSIASSIAKALYENVVLALRSFWIKHIVPELSRIDRDEPWSEPPPAIVTRTIGGSFHCHGGKLAWFIRAYQPFVLAA